VRQQLLDAIYAGHPFRTVLRDLDLTPNQGLGVDQDQRGWVTRWMEFAVFLIFAIPILLYVASLRLNPWVKCSKCNKPKIKGWMADYAHHICSQC
jgi:hypothetical protein